MLHQNQLTIEDLIELSWGGMGHKAGCYADLWRQIRQIYHLRKKKISMIVIIKLKLLDTWHNYIKFYNPPPPKTCSLTELVLKSHAYVWRQQLLFSCCRQPVILKDFHGARNSFRAFRSCWCYRGVTETRVSKNCRRPYAQISSHISPTASEPKLNLCDPEIQGRVTLAS